MAIRLDFRIFNDEQMIIVGANHDAEVEPVGAVGVMLLISNLVHVQDVNGMSRDFALR